MHDNGADVRSGAPASPSVWPQAAGGGGGGGNGSGADSVLLLAMSQGLAFSHRVVSGVSPALANTHCPMWRGIWTASNGSADTRPR